MPGGYEIDAERRLVRSCLSGKLTFDDLETNRERMISDAAFNPDFDRLGDCRNVTEPALTADQVRQFAMHSTFRYPVAPLSSATARRPAKAVNLTPLHPQTEPLPVTMEV